MESEWSPNGVQMVLERSFSPPPPPASRPSLPPPHPPPPSPPPREGGPFEDHSNTIRTPFGLHSNLPLILGGGGSSGRMWEGRGGEGRGGGGGEVPLRRKLSDMDRAQSKASKKRLRSVHGELGKQSALTPFKENRIRSKLDFSCWNK